ncbi:MAG: tetratricopeptide repeat protein, partial [Bacteroidales bacterium]|nr:tetratricopeptide repeat protein [Bacteroidales bacterium]
MRKKRYNSIGKSRIGAVIAMLVCMLAYSSYANGEGKTSPASMLKKGKELYNNKMYQSALEYFSSIVQTYEAKSNTTCEAEGYAVLSQIKLKMDNAHTSAEAYIKKFPHSPLCETVQYNRALLYFDEGLYAQACRLFDLTDKRGVAKDERTGFNFKKGYCKMRTGDVQGAIKIFKGIISEGSSQYLAPSLYYCGYLHYANEEFSKAVPLLERSKNDLRFNILSRYHILESKFFLKDYNYVTTYGPTLYNETDEQSRPNVARIISEAYYALKDTEKARYYFELYTLSGRDLSKNDNFYAGMIAYTLNNHLSATDAFSKVASSKDSIGQNAAYHMGQSYIQLKNKLEAQKAFKLASESNFDPSIKEDALFNYAKLSFDINRNIVPFEKYLGLYPYSDTKWDEIHSYIATEFLLNGNYSDAIAALKKIRNHTPASQQTLQKASFFRAMQLIRNGSFGNAIPYLQATADAPTSNSQLKNLAIFWLSECHYRRDDFGKSMELINQLLKSANFKNSGEYPTSIYNMGYNLLKSGNYTEAMRYFENYLNYETPQKEYTYEAQLRLADCHFMMRDYKEAAEFYEKSAIENGYSTLYAPLQAAIAYGLMDNNVKKCALLEEITGNSAQHVNSPLYSQALYELAHTLIQEVEDEKAERVLFKLINNSKEGLYYFKALNEMGMLYANRKEYDSALECYKKVVEKSPVSEEGQSALAGIESIYQSMNKPQEFLAYLDKVGLSSVKSPDERESMLFNSAEQIFLSGNYTAALAALNRFINSYPDGNKAAQANFYIAECYNHEGKREKAAEYYFKVMETQNGAFSEIATLNYGRLSYSLERYTEAIDAYETLSKIAQLENNKVAAMEGKMKSYFKCKNYTQTIIEANELLANESLKINSNLKREAKYHLAKSHIATDNRNDALPLLKELATDKSDAIGAEATYLLIEDTYASGNFTSVQEQTFAFSDSGSPQTYWLAKSFIILGDSYAEQENFEQALATFNSIKENYHPENGEDDIAGLLNIRLDKLS